MAPKRTIEIEDTLDEIVEAAKDDLTELFAGYCKDNPDTEPRDWEPYDHVSELADAAVPVYTNEIRTLWFLYQSQFEQAYESAGIGNGTEDNYQQAAIFCYIEQELAEHAQTLIEEAQEAWEAEQEALQDTEREEREDQS